jgi:hypothetical protein
MKTIRIMTIVMSFSLALFALAATGAKAQVLSTPNFSGTFTLPVQAQWGTVTLPAGGYTLHYGHLPMAGPYAVEIVGEGKGGPHGVILSAGKNSVSATKNSLACIREGDSLIVKALEIPAIGESVSFALPHGVSVRAKIVADKWNHNAKTQLSEVRIPIERVPVK